MEIQLRHERESLVPRAEDEVAEEGGCGGGDGEKEDGGDAKARGGRRRPRHEEVVDDEVRGEGDEEAGEDIVRLIEGGFEDGHEMGREVLGGMEMRGEVVVVAGAKVEFGEVYVREGF